MSIDPSPIRILTVDGHSILRKGIATLVNADPVVSLAHLCSSARSARTLRLIVRPRHSSARAISLAVCLAVLLSAVAKARGDQWSKTSENSRALPQARVNTATITLPVVDGEGIRFKRLSTDEGLSQTKVSYIVQDDQGFMWFATQYGLNRYDGYNFKLFVHDPGNPNSLSGVYISSLFKDREGALWVGCDQFLDKFDRATETFTRYPVPFVEHISQDSAGMLWLTTSDGLYSLDPVAGTIRHYTHNPDDPSSLSNNYVKSAGEDKEGRFWVAAMGDLDEFDRKTGKVTRHIPIPGAPAGFEFYEDRFGAIWIFHDAPNALSVFDPKTNTQTNYSFQDPEASTVPLTVIMAMTEDREGTLWLATHGAGLLKFDREHRRFVRYRYTPGDPYGLPQNNVENLFADREGSVWAGLGRMGITHFASKPLPFKSIPKLASYDGTPEPFVGAIYEDPQGILWVGTPAALNRIDRQTGDHTLYRRDGGPSKNTDVVAIREDHSGNLWVGTYNHGLLRLDRRTGKFQTYVHNPADPYSLSDDIVMRLLVDHNGTFWIATSNGLNRFDAATGHFTAYKPDPQRRFGSYLELVEDPKGGLWLGTDASGLQRFDPATSQFTRYEHDTNRPGSLSDNRVNSVHFDRSGTMWVGTQDGLDKFDAKTGTFTAYTRREGLPGNAVGCILEDDHGYLWMSTNNGIARFDPQSVEFKRYSTAEGLPGPDLTGKGACYKNQSGEMFFGGFNGATFFHPDRVADTSYTPSVVITEFRLSGRPVDIGGASPLSKAINLTTRLVLSHEQRVFSLGFAALSYFNPGTNRYRYKLEGLDKTWHEVGSDERLATYTTLPAGVYTFRVQGATSRGPWTEPGVQLGIEILPPWYQTLWFLALCVVSFFLLLGGMYQMRLRQVRHEFNVSLEARVSERTRIARDLHDTLLQSFNALLLRFQAASDLLSARPDEAKRVLDSTIDQAGQALIEGRDAVQQLRSTTPVTNDLVCAIGSLGQALAADGSNRDAPAFHIEVEGTPRDLLPITRDEVYQIAGEALRNAFRHARARRLEVEIRYDTRQLRLRIRDDGKGIDPQLLSADGPSGHFGLRGMRERAQLLGGQLTIWSEMNSGTEVDLSIPSSGAYTKPGVSGFWSMARRRQTKS
jgi:ligand-binding sensor domain-containing protein/signal transduction histidine kinase